MTMSSISTVQAPRPQEAFQKTLKNLHENQKKQDNTEVSAPNKDAENVQRTETETMQKISYEFSERAQEIKNFASQYSSAEVDDEDIHYAMRYGTSLLADYTA